MASKEVDLTGNGAVDVEFGGTNANNTTDARINLGLGNVDNTSDANKPISTSTQTELDKKTPDFNVVNLLSLFSVSTQVDGDLANMAGFFANFPQSEFNGGGPLVWQASLNKNQADGLKVFDPNNTGGFDGTKSTLTALFAAQGGGVGFGCWVRIYSGNITPQMCGVNGLSDDSIAFRQCLTVANGNPITHDGTARWDTMSSTSITVPINIAGTGTIDGNSVSGSGLVIGGSISQLNISGIKFKNIPDRVVYPSSHLFVISESNIHGTSVTDCGAGYDLDCTVTDFTARWNLFRNLSRAGDTNAIRAGNTNTYESDTDQKNALITHNQFYNLDATAAGECHGVLYYGRSCDISHNIGQDVVNSFNGTAAECLYTKVFGGSVSFNILTDAGTGQGYINLKGNSTNSERMVCTGNQLECTTGNIENAVHIETNNVSVTKNPIKGFGQFAIDTSSDELDNVFIDDNPITDHLGGIAIYVRNWGVNTAVRRNEISGVAVTAIAGEVFGVYAVNLGGASRKLEISGNSVFFDDSLVVTNIIGVKVQVGGAASLDDAIVLDNPIEVSSPSATNAYDIETQTNGPLSRLKIRHTAGVASDSPLSQLVTSGLARVELDLKGLGAPAFRASPGSTYGAFDGGAGTSHYIKETAVSSTTWAAK